MRFALTDEQEELRALARQFFEAESPIDEVRRVMDTAPGYDLVLWRRLADLGLTGLSVPDAHGGAGASVVEVAVVLREAGRTLLPAPLLPTAVAVAALTAASDGAAADWLPRIAAGEVVAAVSAADARADTRLDTSLTARPDGDGWMLDGATGFVLGGAVADLIVATATTESGVGWFAVRADAAGVSRTPQPALDPTRSLASLTFVGVPATRLSLTRADIHSVGDVAAVLLASEQVGGAERCLDTAVEYAGTRVQFDRPIGSFQAIKHLLADVLVEVEAARAAADYAAWAAAEAPGELPVAAAVAKAQCSEAYVLAAGVNLQVHGGMGFTWEDDAHLHLKRAMSGKQFFGSPEWHRERLAATALAVGGE